MFHKKHKSKRQRQRTVQISLKRESLSTVHTYSLDLRLCNITVDESKRMPTTPTTTIVTTFRRARPFFFLLCCNNAAGLMRPISITDRNPNPTPKLNQGENSLATETASPIHETLTIFRSYKSVLGFKISTSPSSPQRRSRKPTQKCFPATYTSLATAARLHIRSPKNQTNAAHLTRARAMIARTGEGRGWSGSS